MNVIAILNNVLCVCVCVCDFFEHDFSGIGTVSCVRCKEGGVLFQLTSLERATRSRVTLTYLHNKNLGLS